MSIFDSGNVDRDALYDLDDGVTLAAIDKYEAFVNNYSQEPLAQKPTVTEPKGLTEAEYAKQMDSFCDHLEKVLLKPYEEMFLQDKKDMRDDFIIPLLGAAIADEVMGHKGSLAAKVADVLNIFTPMRSDLVRAEEELYKALKPMPAGTVAARMNKMIDMCEKYTAHADKMLKAVKKICIYCGIEMPGETVADEPVAVQTPEQESFDDTIAVSKYALGAIFLTAAFAVFVLINFFVYRFSRWAFWLATVRPSFAVVAGVIICGLLLAAIWLAVKSGKKALLLAVIFVIGVSTIFEINMLRVAHLEYQYWQGRQAVHAQQIWDEQWLEEQYLAEQPETSLYSYIVQPGDTIGSIAARFGVTLAGIVEINNLENPNNLLVGMELIIPVHTMPEIYGNIYEEEDTWAEELPPIEEPSPAEEAPLAYEPSVPDGMPSWANLEGMYMGEPFSGDIVSDWLWWTSSEGDVVGVQDISFNYHGMGWVIENHRGDWHYSDTSWEERIYNGRRILQVDIWEGPAWFFWEFNTFFLPRGDGFYYMISLVARQVDWENNPLTPWVEFELTWLD